MMEVDSNKDFPEQSTEQGFDNAEMGGRNYSSSTPMQRLTRLLVGYILIGGEEFSKALETAQEAVESKPSVAKPDAEETDIDHMRHFMVGTFYQTQKRAIKGVSRGVDISLKASGAMLGTFYALTDNPLLRPMQKPVDYILSNAAKEADQMLRVGRYEEVQSKAMAQETTSEMADEIIDSIVNNPKFTRAIQDVVGSQSLGMVKMFLDGVNEKIAKVDYLIEGIIRKIFRMTPRRDLPKSPIVGKPQFMYLPKNYNPDVDD